MDKPLTSGEVGESVSLPDHGLKPCTAVIVGDIMLDVYFMGDVRRLSPEAPVPLVRVNKKVSTLGGAGNVALNVKSLGSQPVLIGIRGADVAGQQVSRLIEQHDLADALVVDPSRLTTSKTRIIGRGQQLLRLDEEETAAGTATQYQELRARFDASLDRADVVILSDYRKGVLEPPLARELICASRARGLSVLVDPRGDCWEHYRGATCVTPNTGELETVSGCLFDGDEEAMVRAARAIRVRYDIEWLLVTLGPKGMCLIGADGAPLFIRATAREVYDVSGAGDTVIATLAVCVASGVPMPKSAAIANVAAGIVVGKLGSQAIQRGELEAAVRLHGFGARGPGLAKIADPKTAEVQVKAWQATGDTVVCVSGTFSPIQARDIQMLHQAKDLGHRLIIELCSSDRVASTGETVDAAWLPEQERAFMLSALGCVDLVVPLGGESPASLTHRLHPDVLVAPAEPELGALAVASGVGLSSGAVVRVVRQPPGYEHG